MFKFFRNRIRKKFHGTLWLIIMPCIVVCILALFVSIIVTVVLYEPKEKDNKDDTVYKKQPSEYVRSLMSNSPTQTMPTANSTDATLNLLLLNNPVVSDYIKDLFKLYGLTASNTLYKVEEPVTSVESLFGMHLVEGGKYPNTQLPATYIHCDSSTGNLYYNLAYAGYPASAMNLNALNYKVVKDSHIPGSGTYQPTKINSNTSAAYVGPYQIDRNYFGLLGGSSPAAQLSSLTPYNESMQGRKSDPHYFPDQLVYFATQYSSKIREKISIATLDSYNLDSTSKRQVMDVIYSYVHNAGPGKTTWRLYEGLGYNLKPNGNTKATVSADVIEEKTYIEYALDLVQVYTKIPKNIELRTEMGPESKIFYPMAMIVLHPDYRINNYTKNYMSNNQAVSLKCYQELASLPNATWQEALAFIESKTGEPPDQVDKYGVSHPHSKEAVWRESYGTVTLGGKTAKRYQLTDLETLRHNFFSAFCAQRAYAQMLLYMGVPGVDPSDPSTYLSGLQQQGSPIIPQMPSGTLSEPGTSYFQSPDPTNNKVVSNWVTYYPKDKFGSADENGVKDGIPIYDQITPKFLVEGGNYSIYRSNNNGGYVPIAGETLGGAGCGIHTITSILHGIGYGNVNIRTTDTIKKMDEVGDKNGVISPWETSLYLTRYAPPPANGWYIYNLGIRYGFVDWFNHWGLNCEPISDKSVANFKSLLSKNYPIIIRAWQGLKVDAYSLVDGETDLLKPDPIKLDCFVSGTTGGHILFIYGLYQMKTTNGDVLDVFTVVDSGTEFERGANHKFYPLEQFASQIVNCWVVKHPLTGPSGSTPSTGSTGSVITTGNLPDDSYYANKDNYLLNLSYRTTAAQKHRRLYDLPNDKIFQHESGDMYKLEQTGILEYSLYLYRDNVLYHMPGLSLTGLDLEPTTTPKPLNKDIPIKLPSYPRTLTMYTYTVDENYNITGKIDTHTDNINLSSN